jgi:hypothetical protein
MNKNMKSIETAQLKNSLPSKLLNYNFIRPEELYEYITERDESVGSDDEEGIIDEEDSLMSDDDDDES